MAAEMEILTPATMTMVVDEACKLEKSGSNDVDTGIKLLQGYQKAFPKKRPAPSHPGFSCITDDYPEGQKSRCEMILRLAYHNITKEVVTSGTHFR